MGFISERLEAEEGIFETRSNVTHGRNKHSLIHLHESLTPNISGIPQRCTGTGSEGTGTGSEVLGEANAGMKP
jgi:hypothetical protein